MNEQDFKDGLRRAMATQQEPPPMSDAPVLDAARRDRKRRRTLWAGLGSAAAVAAIAVGVVVVAPSTSDSDDGDLGVGGAPPSVTTTGPESTPAKLPESGSQDTETQWPDGQTDRTASSGPQFDKGLALATELDAVVPDGYESPHDLVGDGDLAGASMWSHQAQYADTVDGVDLWEYMADIPVTKGNGVGRLLAEVRMADPRTPGEGCDLVGQSWTARGECEEVMVDGRRVGLVTVATPEPGMDQFDQWAGYRHDDGTVVMISQAKFRAYTNFPPLAGPPFTARQLAELAADDRFDLD
jgi:hypothetical protein